MEEEHIHCIREAIEKKNPISLRYVRADGRLTKHRVVYPHAVYHKGNHGYFKAYSSSTEDVRTFRIDRIQSLRRKRHVPPFHIILINLGFVAIVILAILQKCGLIAD